MLKTNIKNTNLRSKADSLHTQGGGESSRAETGLVRVARRGEPYSQLFGKTHHHTLKSVFSGWIHCRQAYVVCNVARSNPNLYLILLIRHVRKLVLFNYVALFCLTVFSAKENKPRRRAKIIKQRINCLSGNNTVDLQN